MTLKRLLAIVGLIVTIAALTSAVLVLHWERTPSPLKNLPKLLATFQRYSKDHAKDVHSLKDSISLQDLVAGGYLSAEDIRDYNGMDIVFYPNGNESSPQSILLSVRMPDGHQLAAMADGSIQELPKK